MRGIIKRMLPVNSSVLNMIIRINPIGNTNPDRSFAMLGFVMWDDNIIIAIDANDKNTPDNMALISTLE